MRNAFDLKYEKILELLERLGLKSQEIEAAEAYLEHGEEEALKKLPEIDFEKAKTETVTTEFSKIYHHLKHKGLEQEYVRCFHLFFAIGGCTFASLLPGYEFHYDSILRDEFATQIDPAIFISIYAESRSSYLYASFIDNIVTLMKQQKEPLDQLFGKINDHHKKHCTCSAMLPLYCAYFKIKEEESRSKENFSLEGEAASFLKDYEDCIVSRLKSLSSSNKGSKTVDDKALEEFVRTKHEDSSLSEAASLLITRYQLSESSFVVSLGCAFLNRNISYVFYNFVNVCLHINTTASLNIIDRVAFLSTRYQYYQNRDNKKCVDSCIVILEEFSVIMEKALYWLAEVHTRTTYERDYTLEYCAEKHKEEYVKALENAKAGSYAIMFSSLKRVDKERAEQLLAVKREQLKKQYVNEMLAEKKVPFYSDLCQFISGEKEIDILYLHQEEIFNCGISFYGSHSKAFDDYMEIFGIDDTMKRFLAYYCFAGNSRSSVPSSSYALSSIFKHACREKDTYSLNEKKVVQFFESVDSTGLSIFYQLNAMGTCYEEGGSTDKLIEAVIPVLVSYLKTRKEETLKAFQEVNASGRMMGVVALGKSPEDYQQELLCAFSDPSKAVRNCLVEIISQKEEFRQGVVEKLHSKKATERETAVHILKKWKKPEDIKELELALEKEKSSKVSALISEVLGIKTEEKEEEKSFTLTDFVKNMAKGNRKKTLAWAFETPFCIVHDKEGKEVDNDYMMALLLCYSSMNIPGINKDAPALAENLNPQELAAFMKELFGKWVERGAEAKKKWVLYASAIHGGAEIIADFQHYINEWPKMSRGAIASEAVKALALNSSPSALLIVDSISRKFKFRQVKNAAAEALDFAAQQLGITKEELADRIVPDLGFNENMERIFDYGERQFKVYINQALEIEVYDNKDKKLKNLPAPGKRDDEVKAAEAYAEFKLMKKQMKTTVATQKTRLELALSSERKWKCEDWEKLFIKNPIMHQFAISLIWGVYEEGELKDTFRYMEDGSFNTEEEEEYELQKDCLIGLVHPIELTEDQKNAWKEQLEDYEITQSIEQLDRRVYEITEEELKQKYLERFGGKVVNDLSFNGKLSAMGWYRGSVLDAGGFYQYYREDAALSLGVEIHFSGTYVGGENQDVTVYHAIFYKTRYDNNGSDGSNSNNGWTVQRGSYIYDEIKEEQIVRLNDVPKRYFSEIVYQLDKATASSTETDSNWKRYAYRDGDK